MSHLDDNKSATHRAPIESPESRLIKLGCIPDPLISNFISSIPRNFSQLTDILRASLRKELKVNSRNEFVSNNRIMLEKYARQFHSQSDTLSDNLAHSLSLLSDPDTIILSATHQPNLFPYSGVIKKIILLESLKRHLQHLDRRAKVVNLFVIIDQEFADDKWITRAELPSINHGQGVLALSLRLSNSDRRRMVKNVPKPDLSILKKWDKQITSWILDNLRNVSQDTQTKKNQNMADILQESQYFGNFRQFWTQVQYAHSISQTLSDFNSFTFAKVINDIFGLDTIFVRLTELSPVVEEGIAYLIKNFDKYSTIIRRTEMTLLRYGINSRVGSNVYSSAPVWLHCKCGSKASLKMSSGDGKQNDDLVLSGKCVRCGMYLERDIGKKTRPELDEMIKETSLRAIPIPLLLSRDLGASCYVTGTGGVGYLTDSAVIANELSIPFPIVALWGGRDTYLGLAQRASLKRMNVQAPVDIEPCLKALEIDYTIYAGKIRDLVKQRSERIKDGHTIDNVLRDLFVLKQHQRDLRSGIERAQRATNAIKLSPCYVDYVINFGLQKSFNEWHNYLQQTGDLLEAFTMGSDLPDSNITDSGTKYGCNVSAAP